MTSSCSVDLHLGRYSKRFGRTWAEMVILGTQYAGEMKKGILTLMMYRMPLLGQLCLHSSANEDDEGNDTLSWNVAWTPEKVKKMVESYAASYAKAKK